MDFVECKRSSESDTFDEVQKHDSRIAKVNYISEDDKLVLEAYLLPKSIDKWPTMWDSKQVGVVCPDIYLRRIESSSEGRLRMSLSTLVKAHTNMIWIGSPGIAKSADINMVLMVLLKDLGRPDWPEVVSYRIRNKIYEFKLDDSKTQFKLDD